MCSTSRLRYRFSNGAIGLIAIRSCDFDAECLTARRVSPAACARYPLRSPAALPQRMHADRVEIDGWAKWSRGCPSGSSVKLSPSPMMSAMEEGLDRCDVASASRWRSRCLADIIERHWSCPRVGVPAIVERTGASQMAALPGAARTVAISRDAGAGSHHLVEIRRRAKQGMAI